MSTVSTILQQMAENAGRAQIARGQTYGSLVAAAANVPAQIMDDRERQATLDLQRLYAARRDARETADQAYQDTTRAQQLERDRIVRIGLAAAMGPDGDPSQFDAKAAFQAVSRLGRPEAMTDVIAVHQKMQPPRPYETDPTKDLRNPITNEILTPGRPKLPEIGTPGYEIATRIQDLEGPGAPPAAPGAPPPAAGVPTYAGRAALLQNGPPPSPVPAGGPGAPATTAAPPAPTDYGYGPRYGSSTPKGLGYLGPLQRPDNGNTMSEYSIGVNIGGKETQIPSIVPTLTKDEIAAILTAPEGTPPPASAQQKAIAYAQQRIAKGLDPFAGPGEQQNLFPELPRNPIPTPQASAPGAPAATLGAPPAAAPPPRLTHAQAVAKAYADAQAAKDPILALYTKRASGATLTPDETAQIAGYEAKKNADDAPVTIKTMEGGRMVEKVMTRADALKAGLFPSQPPASVQVQNMPPPPSRPANKAEIAIANYQVPPPSPRTFATPAGQAMLDRILTVNPDYDQSMYAVRAPTRKAYTIGTQGQQLVAISTAIQHLDLLQSAADALNNGTLKPGNAIYNALADTFGSAAPTSFDTIKEKVDKELDAVAQRGAPTVSGAAAQKGIGGRAASPAAIKSYIDSSIELMGGSHNALRTPYQAAMGANAPFNFLSPQAKEILIKRGFDPDNPDATFSTTGGGGAPKEGDTQPIAGHPGTEQTYKGGKWIRTK